MKALMYYGRGSNGRGDFRLEDVAEPTVVPGTVKIDVEWCGICGSDLHLLVWNLPATFGHEFAGTLPDGRPVAVEPLKPCRRCEACVRGAYNLCVLGPAMVLGVSSDGGMADECIVPAEAIVPLPSGVSLADA